MDRLSKKLDILILFALLLTYLLWLVVPLSSVATDNIRLIEAFNTDEPIHVELIRSAYQLRSFHIYYEVYPHLYFNLCLAVLFVLEYFTTIDDQVIIIVLRLVPGLFGIGTLLLTYVIAREHWGRMAANVALLLLAFMPVVFLKYTVMSHPDIPQVGFMMLALWALGRYMKGGKIGWVVLATVGAGLAFATKYGGVFLLPVLLLALLIKALKNESTLALGARIGMGVLAAGLLMGLFFTFDPDRYVKVIEMNFAVNLHESNKLFLLMRLVQWVAVFAMVLVAVFQALPFLMKRAAMSDKMNRIIFWGSILVYVFGITFFIASPYIFVDFRLLSGLIQQSEHISFGHWFMDEADNFSWFGLLGEVVSYPLLIVGMASLPFMVANSVSHKKHGLLSMAGLTLLWVVIFFSYLALRVKAGFAHYLLPILPALILLVAFTITQMVLLIRRWLTTFRPEVSIALVSLLLISTLPFGFRDLLDFRKAALEQGRAGNRIKAGAWLKHQLPETASIYYDHYSYIPPTFKFAYVTWGGTLDGLKAIDPDAIVVNQELADQYENQQRADLFIGGAELYLQKRAYYESLRTGIVPYVEAERFGKYIVYEKQGDWPKLELGDTVWCTFTDMTHFDNPNDWVGKEMIITIPVENQVSGTKWDRAFSTTFRKQVDSLPLLPGYVVSIKARVENKQELAIDGQLVASMETAKGQTYLYKSTFVSKFLKAPDIWQEVVLQFEVPGGMQPTDWLKVYLWSPKSTPYWIDDLEIMILE